MSERPKLFKPSVEQSLGFAGCCRRNPEADPFREGYPSTDEVFTAYIVALSDEVVRLRTELGDTTYCDACAALRVIAEESR